MNFKRKTLLLIAIATVLRCIIASCVELGNDEVYYRMYAQDLQWNYFDHPPFVGWLIRLSTFNLKLDTELFIRFGAILSSAISTWFIYLCGKKLKDEYTGFLAACLYTFTLYGSIIAGTFILPDSPQMVFWTASLYVLIGMTDPDQFQAPKWSSLLLFGVLTGLGMLCKIHTSFLWFGLLLYILLYNRKWLLHPGVYVSGIITLLFFAPVIEWNIQHHFVTYLYHSKRVNIASGGGIDLSAFFTYFGGQVFYFNPVLFPFFIIGMVWAIKGRLPVFQHQKNILLLCGLPLILMATAISFFKEVLPHWTGPAYSSLILLTAAYFAQKIPAGQIQKQGIPRVMQWAGVFITMIAFAGILVIHFYPGTLSSKAKPFTGDGDFTVDMYGWKEMKTMVDSLFKKDDETGAMKKESIVVCNKWFPGAHLDYYVTMPLKRDIQVLGDTSDIHQYAWLNQQRKPLKPGDDAYMIVPSEDFFDVRLYQPFFQTIIAPEILEQKRNGKTIRYIYVFRLKNYQGQPGLLN